MREDLNAKLIQRAELVGCREELDAAYEGLKTSAEREIEYYHFECKAQKKLDKIKGEVSHLEKERKELLNSIDFRSKDVKAFNEKLFEADKAYQNLISERNEKIKFDNKEMSRLEEEIYTKAEEFKIDSLHRYFNELCSGYGSHIEREILQK